MIPAVKRPSIVTLAGALLYAVAAILVLRALLPLPFLGAVTDAAKEAYATSTDPNLTGDDFARALQIGLIGSSVLSVLFGIGLAVLAMFDLRGKNIARILTWVFGGLGVVCCGLGSALSSASSFTANSNNSGIDTKAAADRIADAYPSWYQPASIALTVVMTVALIAVIIMLLLPEANAYFRSAKSAAAEVPPVAEPPYPTLPA